MSSSQGLFGSASPTFGTPSYPTHLDMIRGLEAGPSAVDISYHSHQESNSGLVDSFSNELKSGLQCTDQKDSDLASSKSK